MKVSRFHWLFILASSNLAISGCDNVKKMYPDMYNQMIQPKELVIFTNSHNQKQQNEVNLLPNDKAKIEWSILNDDEKINEVARIVEKYGAKLQSLGHSGDSELSLKISYYPKELTHSDFEHLEKELKQLTGVNVTVFRKSISIKPLY